MLVKGLLNPADSVGIYCLIYLSYRRKD